MVCIYFYGNFLGLELKTVNYDNFFSAALQRIIFLIFYNAFFLIIFKPFLTTFGIHEYIIQIAVLLIINN